MKKPVPSESVSSVRVQRNPVRDRVVGGSNPLAPTNSLSDLRESRLPRS